MSKVYSFATVASIVEAYAEGALLLIETPSLMVHAVGRLKTDDEVKAAVACLASSEFGLWSDRTPEEWALPRAQRPKRTKVGTRSWAAEVARYLAEFPDDGDDGAWLSVFQIKGYPPRDPSGVAQEQFAAHSDAAAMTSEEASDRAEFRKGVITLRRALKNVFHSDEVKSTISAIGAVHDHVEPTAEPFNKRLVTDDKTK